VNGSDPGRGFREWRGPRYLLVGSFNTLFGLGLFGLLLALFEDRVHYLALLVISHVVAVLTAFVLHRKFVFRVKGQVLQDLWRFWTVYLAALGANLVLLPLAVEVAHLSPLVGQICVLAVTATATYVAHARFSFSPARPRPSATAPPLPVSRKNEHG
jgi:putative flippase GtrA